MEKICRQSKSCEKEDYIQILPYSSVMLLKSQRWLSITGFEIRRGEPLLREHIGSVKGGDEKKGDRGTFHAWIFPFGLYCRLAGIRLIEAQAVLNRGLPSDGTRGL